MQQKITWGQWAEEKWNDEKLNAIGLGRCAQLLKLDPKNYHLIEAAIIIKAYGLTTPYGAELDETAIDYGVYRDGGSIHLKIHLNTNNNWKNIITHFSDINLTKQTRQNNQGVFFPHPSKNDINPNDWSHNDLVIATINTVQFKEKTLELFIRKCADESRSTFTPPLQTNQNAAYTTLCSKISELSLPPNLTSILLRLQTDQVKNPIIPTLVMNELLGCLVHHKNLAYQNQGIESEKIQHFLNAYQVFQTDELFLSRLYKKWETTDKTKFLLGNLPESVIKKIIDSMPCKSRPNIEEILGYLLFLAYQENKVDTDLVNKRLLAFSQTFNMNLSASALYTDYFSKNPLGNLEIESKNASFIQFLFCKCKNYLPNKPYEVVRFLTKLQEKLDGNMLQIDWNKMRDLTDEIVFNDMIDEINLSLSGNSSLPTLDHIFNLVFEKFKTNQLKVNDEIDGYLNMIALILKNAIGLKLNERVKAKEEKISNALKVLDTQLAQQQVRSTEISQNTTKATKSFEM